MKRIREESKGSSMNARDSRCTILPSVFVSLVLLMLLMVSTLHGADLQQKLIWTANIDFDLSHYEVWQAEVLGDKSGPWVQVGIANVNEITVTVDDTKNWQWVVYAIDKTGNRSMPSNTATLRDETPPKTVEGVEKEQPVP
jgi:hypothetical protein